MAEVQAQSASQRKASINRTLDALEVVASCLAATEPGPSEHKAATESCLRVLKEALGRWYDYEKDKLA